MNRLPYCSHPKIFLISLITKSPKSDMQSFIIKKRYNILHNAKQKTFIIY